MTNVGSFILQDTRPIGERVLNFNIRYLISDIEIIIDSDNDVKFLIFTDGLNSPVRQLINVERSRLVDVNGFEEDDINLIKRPPIDPPTAVGVRLDGEMANNLEDKFLSFAYRYQYLDRNLVLYHHFLLIFLKWVDLILILGQLLMLGWQMILILLLLLLMQGILG